MMDIKLSIIIPVLNSHEIFNRQLKYFKRIGIPDDVEVIIVDDGSNPPLSSKEIWDKSLTLIVLRTNDIRPWTQPRARNIGAKCAFGETLLFTDIDHIISKKAIEFGRSYPYDYGRFRRELGVLDEDGNLTQDARVLMEWGVPREKVFKSLHVGCHIMSQYIKAEVFEKVGGFRENLTHYPTHDDLDMKRKLKPFKKCPDNERPKIYVFPNAKFSGSKNANPHGFFHELKR